MYRITVSVLSSFDQSMPVGTLADVTVESMNLELFMRKLADALNAAMRSKRR